MSERKEPRATVSSVEPGSPAAQVGLEPGDVIESINGRVLTDILEYRFQMAADRVVLSIRKPDGRRVALELPAGAAEGFGIDFEDPLFDGIYTCDNKCVFCFVHQSPKKMRRTLYIMDDDYRLSFWHGHFVTLTNLSPEDVQRIVDQRMSPLNVSVHATEDDLREMLMGTPKARGVMRDLKMLIDAGIELNTQLVLCPSLNDGEHLDRSIQDLAGLYPGVLTVSAVPVGLTKHREKLFPLDPYTREQARATIAQIEAWQERLLKDLGTRLVFVADEFYSKAGLEVPPAEAYEGYPQLENGIGLLRQLLDDFAEVEPLLPPALEEPRRVSAVTGVSAASTVRWVVDRLNRIGGLQVDLTVVENDFYGHSVTVAGLLTGQDVLRALQGRDLGETVFLPEVMFRDGADKRVTLDEYDLDDLVRELGRPIERLPRNGRLAAEMLTGQVFSGVLRVPAPTGALAAARRRRARHCVN
ncbi:MAG: DUF512 domain-containing protein [Bacillota bacterium]